MRFELRFINSPGLVSAGIDWATNSLWDHVEILTPSGTYIGAHAGAGIQERPADYCKPTRERRYSIPCSDSQAMRIQNFAHSKLGTPYNYADIFGLLLHNRHLNSQPREICSQFVFEAATQGGIWLLNVLPKFAHLVTPETLHLSPLLMSRCTYDSETAK